MSSERRHERMVVNCPVTIHYDADAPSVGTVYDLSVDGCAIESEPAMPAESHIVLEIALRGIKAPVKVELARVTWSTRREFGVQFVLLSGSERARLERFLAAR